MNSIEYVKSKLDSFIIKDKFVSFCYEYDDDTLTHIVKVSPKEIYDNNKDYISWENKLIDEFIDNYPNENICFISDGALIEIKNPIYIIDNNISGFSQNCVEFLGLNFDEKKNKEFINNNCFNRSFEYGITIDEKINYAA